MTTSSKESAKFVFVGTVKGTGAANVKAIADKTKTAIVRVEELVRAPHALASFAGRDVTVQLAKGERVKKGQQALFYTNGWIFGENLAVKSLGHDPKKQKAKAAAVAEVVPGVEPDHAVMAAHQNIRERAAEAPVVISGKVVAVGLPGPHAASATAAATPAKRPISEHDPFWREAVVQVQQVHKGQLDKNQVVVRFPSSTDVRWYHAPKFHVGHEGVFSLRPDQLSGHVAPGIAAASFAPSESSFTCLDAADFQPADHQPEVAAAIAAAKK